MDIAGHSINIPCGCQERKQIMTAGDWTEDLLALAVAAFVLGTIVMLAKKGVL